jgi:hypothetical protein
VFTLPIDPDTLQRYQLTELKAKLLNLTVIVPLMLIWLTALYGFISLKQYANKVAGSKEGRAFRYLSLGLMVLAFSLPLNSLIATCAQQITNSHGNLLVPTTIIRNHVVLILSLVAFFLLVKGALELAKTVKRRDAASVPGSYIVGLLSLSAIYGWLITSRPLNHGIQEKAYFMPNWLLIFTLVIPYLLAWKAGAWATYYLYTFHKSVKGIVYKSAFKDLAWGIGVVVSISILIQLITTSSAQLSRLNLTPILLIIYGLLLLYAVGFGLVARGAKKLKRLEEV